MDTRIVGTDKIYMKKKMPEVEEITRCPECKSKHLTRDYEARDLVCEDCGLVIDGAFIGQGAERRAFGRTSSLDDFEAKMLPTMFLDSSRLLTTET